MINTNLPPILHLSKLWLIIGQIFARNSGCFTVTPSLWVITSEYQDKLYFSRNYNVFQKSDAKIEIVITATNLIRIKYPLSSLNYQLSGANVANFNKIHCTVFKQQLFKKWSSKTEVSNMEKSP